MARNKKKSKAQQHSSDDDERASNAGSEENKNVPVATPEADGKDHSDKGNDSGDDEEQARQAKKLERIAEMQARKNKKKGDKAKEKKKAIEAAGSHKGTDDDDDEIEVTRQAAVEVLYCPICTFPAEMCEFSGMMDKCRPWLQEHAAELADAEERGRKRRILTEKERLDAMVEGRGIKKALERVVVLDVEKRVGQRMITSVFGMDLFNFNLKDLSRDWRKAFACGAGVRAAEEGKHQDCIDIQGSVEVPLAEMLVKKYNIPKDSIYIIRSKKKVKYFDDDNA